MIVEYYCSDKQTQYHAVDRIRGDLAKNHQCTIKESRQAGTDLLLVQSESWKDEYLERDLPIVLIEKIDGPQMTNLGRRLISHPQVKQVVKTSIYNKAEYYDRHSCRRHVLKMGGMRRKEPRVLIGEHYHKLNPLITFGLAPRVLKFLKMGEINFSEKRKWPSSFHGTVSYDGVLTTHRKQACAAVMGAGGIAQAGRTLFPNKYRRMLRTVKSVTSPWGWGEPTYRDYEAILSGAVLIKPHTPWMRVGDSVYRHCRWCKHDFSDVGSIVDDIVANWDRDQETRWEHFELLKRELSTELQSWMWNRVFEDAIHS